MNLNKNFTVSVLMSTYNHSEFIEDAINSVLMQKCDFNVELIIADDFSTDNTKEIVSNLINKHHNGNWIKYTRHTINKGAYFNALWILNQANNKYIALCEGDDYWTDSMKLQKQIDFLEKNEEYNLCYHDVLILNPQGIFTSDFIKKTNKNITTKYDLAVWGNYIHTCSVVIRNNNFLEKFSTEIWLCDYISYMEFVNDGKIKKIDETMSVYRYGEGIWASSTSKIKYKFLVDNIHNILKTTDDDTIKEIMNLRLNTIALHSLPKYITILENIENRTYKFELNERIPFSVLINIFFKKLNFFFKKYKLVKIK